MVDGVALLADAGLGGGVEADDLALGDDVDDAGDGIGPVCRRGTVLEDLDALDNLVGDGVQVDEVAHAVVGERVERRAQAVE